MFPAIAIMTTCIIIWQLMDQLRTYCFRETQLFSSFLKNMDVSTKKIRIYYKCIQLKSLLC